MSENPSQPPEHASQLPHHDDKEPDISPELTEQYRKEVREYCDIVTSVRDRVITPMLEKVGASSLEEYMNKDAKAALQTMEEFKNAVATEMEGHTFPAMDEVERIEDEWIARHRDDKQ